MQNLEKRISEIENKMKIYFLKDSDYAIKKLFSVLNKKDSDELRTLVKARKNKSVERLFLRLVKKYADNIRKVELTESQKRIFAEGFNKSRKNLSDKVNMILDKTELNLLIT